MIKYIFKLFLICLLIYSCSSKEKEISQIKEINQELEMSEAYKIAYSALNEGDPYYASQKFLEAELSFPQSIWAPRSALMASYAFYLQNFYPEALSNLERYLLTYPNDKNHAYAHYLIAMCYYENIEDEKRDLGPLIKSRDKFNYIIKEYPNTEFSLDSHFKVELIEDILASKEMYIGRHYMKKGKWIPAINRFKNVLTDYSETIFVDEALHRLVELNYTLGLLEEAKKYAVILGYNYQSSEWYEKSYSILNPSYLSKIKKPQKKDKKSVVEKFKTLFD
jgi:outer membrane protein assembly factor BamD